MPVEWRATLGYGFQVDLEHLEENVGEDDNLCQDFDGTVSSRYPLLDVFYAGNLMTGTGNERWVFPKESVVHLRDWSVGFDIDKLNNAMSGEGMDELFRFVNDTAAVTGNLQWRILLYCG